MLVEIVEADYTNERHGRDLILLLDAYARDPMGGAEPLKADVKARLVDELATRADAFSVMAYVDDQPAGLVNCFEGYSTFSARPLVNVHDVVVLPGFRGMGLSRKMFDRIESIARGRGCCKLTLEVLANNETALSAYRRFGFKGYQLVESAGHALFLEKPLVASADQAAM